MNRWSDAARSVWGKTDRANDTSMPLVRHLVDSVAVAGFLWDHWLPPSIRQQISAELPDGEADGRILLTWLAGVHDIGKASPAFAVKARKAPGFGHLVGQMEDHGLICGRPIEPLPPHCHVGHGIMMRWLESRGVSRSAATSMAVVVGGHHGVQPDTRDLQDIRIRREHYGSTPPWVAVQDEILGRIANITGADRRLSAWATSALRPTSQVLLTAGVVVADWLASDAIRFPHQDNSTTADRLERAALDRDLPLPWRPESHAVAVNDLLTQRFPRLTDVRANSVQAAALEMAQSASSPCLMVIEAPMGAGKTEAALMAAEVLAARFGQGGLLVGLPTMATSNAMFGRVLDWLDHTELEGHASVTLAHSKAGLDDRYAGLVSRGRVAGVGEPEDQQDSAAMVSAWLRGRRKGVLASMVVGTIDQALFGALKVRHVALRHLALAGKVVVLDEVHAADAYMQRYLLRVLEWLGAYGTPVVLLSATLPRARRAELLSAYAKGRQGPELTGPQSAPSEQVGYPRISMQSTALSERHVAWNGRRVAVAVEALHDGNAALVAAVRAAVEDGACVAVIRNTVRRAQDAYAALVDALGAGRVELLHSQFVAVDRAAREKRLRDALGPGSAGRPLGYVVVGTQVLEQSLDIDVDLMVSDLAPIDLVLQRMGRLHRHARGVREEDRPPSVQRPRFLLTGVSRWDEQPPHAAPGSQAIYGASALLRAAAVLSPHLGGRPIQIPDDVPRLVDAAYTPELASPTGWEEAWDAADAEARERVAEREANAQTFMLGDPFASGTLVGWLNGRTTDHGSDDAGARPQVRDGEDGIEVVVVQDIGGELRTLPREDGSYDVLPFREAAIDDPVAKRVAGYSLRLPARLSRGARGGRVITELENQARDFTGWQQSRWLRGVLVLLLDRDLNGEVAGTAVRYDLQRGLLVGAEEQVGGRG